MRAGIRHKTAFTLIELLVVISIIALLIALLLPTLAQARASANNVVCAANQKQMALGIMHYTEDHDGSLPPGDDGGSPRYLWPETLIAWTGDPEIYDCKAHLGGFPGHNSYVANGYWWGFAAMWISGVSPTRVRQIKSPARWAMITENTEDWSVAQQNPGRTTVFGPQVLPASGPGQSRFFWADYQLKLNYQSTFNPGTRGAGGRHFRSGSGKVPGFGGAKFDPWGFDNISFADGHVTSYGMMDIVQQNSSLVWFEYPFVPAAAQNNSQTPSGPQPGAEWYMYPFW